jgi:hypothetical protein
VQAATKWFKTPNLMTLIFSWLHLATSTLLPKVKLSQPIPSGISRILPAQVEHHYGLALIHPLTPNLYLINKNSVMIIHSHLLDAAKQNYFIDFK